MYAITVSIIIVVALVLILVVLAQNPKGGGLSSQFGGAGTQQIMGVKKTGDFLEKLTWGCAVALLVLTLTTNFFISENTQTITSPNIENAQESVLPTQGLAPLDDAASDEAIEDLGLESDSAN